MFYLYNRATAFRRIARTLRVDSVYPYRGRHIHRRNRLTHYVNIGCSHINWSINDVLINNVLNKTIVVSKVHGFQKFQDAGIPHPTPFENRDAAIASGVAYLGRHDGLSGGRGIVIYAANDIPVQEHDFYVPIIPCRREFRIHVWRGDILVIQKKRIEHATSIIHNHDNGVLFQVISTDSFNIGERTTQRIKDIAIGAVQCLGYDFGAVDILQSTDNCLYVLEVNSAPGISSVPVYNAYMNAIQQLMVA